MKAVYNFLKNNKRIITFCKLFILAVFLLLSFVEEKFIEVLLVLSIIFSLTEFDFDGFYYSFFLVNFRFVFRHNYTGAIPYVSVFFVCYALFAIIKFIFIKKEKIKFNWWVIGLSLAYLIYLLLPLHPFIFNEYIKFVLMVFVINFIFIFKDKIDFKKLVYFFVAGQIIACFTFLITDVLYDDVFYQMELAVYTSTGRRRFSGLSGDPNYQSLDLILSISSLCLLNLKEKLSNRTLFILLSILFAFGLLTYSKVMMLTVCVFFVLYAIFIMLSKKEQKFKSFISVVASFLVAWFVVDICFDRGTIASIFIRFKDEAPAANILFAAPASWLFAPTSMSSFLEGLDGVTTGRISLWLTHLDFVFSSLTNFLFGGGIGTYVGIMECHNTYIQTLYETGFIGLTIFLVLFFAIMRFSGLTKHHFKYKNFINWLPFCLFAIMIFSVNYLGSTSFIYHFSIAIFAIFYMNGKKFEESNLKPVKVDKLAIVTPTYNREKLLRRTFESLKRQTNKNFVWYIIDDGSVDNTEKLVKSFDADFKIIYKKKKNGGKHTALNYIIPKVKESFLLILDSDDFLTENCCDVILEKLNNIKEDNICGISFLKGSDENNFVGKPYTKDGIVDSFVNQRYNKRTIGDKAEVFRTDILQQYPFAVFENERFTSEAQVWCQISGKYKMIFYNQIIYICEYQVGGLSDNVRKTLYKNPKGACACYKQLTTMQFNLINRCKYTLLYTAHGLIAHYSLRHLFKNSGDKLLFVLLLPLSFVLKLKRSRSYDK